MCSKHHSQKPVITVDVGYSSIFIKEIVFIFRSEHTPTFAENILFKDKIYSTFVSTKISSITSADLDLDLDLDCGCAHAGFHTSRKQPVCFLIFHRSFLGFCYIIKPRSTFGWIVEMLFLSLFAQFHRARLSKWMYFVCLSASLYNLEGFFISVIPIPNCLIVCFTP